MKINLPHPWDAYLRLQEQEDRITKIGHRERAGDEKMTAFLEAVENGTLPDSREEVDRKMVNLEVNRQKKHRWREMLALEWAEQSLSDIYFPNAAGNLETSEQLCLIRRHVDAKEWRILWALANGSKYKAVSAIEDISCTGLKMAVSRLRTRLRKCLIASQSH